MPRYLRTYFAAIALALGVCHLPLAIAGREELLPPPARTGAEVLPASQQVVDVRIVGNETVSTIEIANYLNTKIGRAFDETVVEHDVRRLANLGWFVDVRPLYETTPQGHVVIFEVVERPTIRYVFYIGNLRVSDKTLAKQTNLKEGGSVDPYAVEEGRRKLREYYISRGYNNVQITIREGDKPGDQGVAYLINEGVPQKIWKVMFVGNEFVSDRRLKNLIKSKPPILKVFKGYVDREQLEADLDQLTTYYRSFGFFQARIGRKLEFNEKGNWVNVTFVIDEGPRYQVRDVRFIGNTKFVRDALKTRSELQPGAAFEQAKMQKDASWLRDLYGSHGYVFADIRPETVFLEEPGEVDLVYHIDEGGQFRVGRIFVHIGGDNPHTRIQTALNRLSVRPGDIMDTREIRASERRLIASSLYEVNAASGMRPKITFRIPEDSDLGLAMNATPTSIRGQDPISPGALVLPPPGFNHVRGFERSLPRLADNAMDVHVYCRDYQHYRKWQEEEAASTLAPPGDSQPTDRPKAAADIEATPANSAAPIIRGQNPNPQQPARNVWWRATRTPQPTTHRTTHRTTTARPAGPYANIRGQSPAADGRTQQRLPVYASLPTTSGSSPYGGQVVQATGPSAMPRTTSGVQPAQYSPQLQPPAGSVLPTPLNPLGPLPGQTIWPDGTYGITGQPGPDQTVDIFIDAMETQTGRFMLGVGVNSDAGVVGNVVIDERNFDWRNWPRNFEDVRNGAWRGDGQRLRIDMSPGSQVNRYLVSFTEPYLFDRPISLGLSGSFFDRRYRDWDEQRLGGRVSVGRQWVERDVTASLSYRGESIEVRNISSITQPDLIEALGDNSLHGFRATIINDTRDSAFLATQGHYFEIAGEQVIGTFDYPRVTLDMRKYFLLFERPDHSGRHVLSASANFGYTGTHTPIYEHFFAGGFSTLRGFDFRGASPIDIANGFVEVGGHFQWINSVQYLFPITADEMLHGVVFTDFGTVEPDIEINDFRVTVGTGLRVTVPAMGPAPIALDFGWAIAHADTDDREVFSFSLGFSR